VCPLSLPHGDERWLVVRTAQGEQRAAASMEQVVLKEQEHWTKALWHLSNQAFACTADTEAALTRQTATLPPWLSVARTVDTRTLHTRRGRPATDAVGTTEWTVRPTLTRHPRRVARKA